VRVLVTGADGFLGRHLVGALRSRGDEVVAMSLDRGPLDPDLPFHAVDVRDGEAVRAVVAASDPAVVVHLAALSHVGSSWTHIPDYYSVNIVGTENVLKAAGSRRFLFSSSAEVYGAVPESEQPIDEKRAPAPRSPYALTKAVAERGALDAGGIVVRSFNLLGAGQTPNFALPSFAAQLAAMESRAAPRVLRVGNLAARRDFVNVEDAIDALVHLIDRGEGGTVYNLASGEAHSIESLLDRLSRIAGIEARREIDPERMRPVDMPLLCGRADRLRALGWTPRRGIDQALRDLWQEALAAAVQPA